MSELTIKETIERIDQLIDAGRGDPGRLDYIRESLRNNKVLFKSDRQYLESLLESYVEFKSPETQSSPLLPRVKKLIDSGSGDYGRLQSIYESLLKGKSLYQSDYNYVQKKFDDLSTTSTYEGHNTVDEITPQQTLSSGSVRGTMPKGWHIDSG